MASELYTKLSILIFPTVLGFLLGVLIKPWIERNFVYRYLIDPIEVYLTSEKIKGVNRLNFEVKKREAYPFSEKIALINKSNETIIISKIRFSFKDIQVDKGGVTWVHGITDNENILDDYIQTQKDWFRKDKPKANKKIVSTWGGTTKNLSPIVLEPNKPIKLYSKVEPVVHTKSTPNKIKVKLDLILKTSKKNKNIKLGIFEWKQLGKIKPN